MRGEGPCHVWLWDMRLNSSSLVKCPLPVWHFPESPAYRACYFGKVVM